MLRLACFYAKQSREEFLRTWKDCKDKEVEKVKEETKQFLTKLRKYCHRRWKE